MKFRGITLVELLVVISVIAIAISVSSPCLRLVREGGKRAVCISNQRQLGLAFQLYDNSNGSLPYGFQDNELYGFYDNDAFLGDPSINRRGLWWINFLSREIGFDSEDVFWCPSRKIYNDLIKDNILHANYGVNLAVCIDSQSQYGLKAGRPASMDKIRRPVETFILADCGYSIINQQNTTETPLLETNPLMTGASYIPGLLVNAKRKTFGIYAGQDCDAFEGRHLASSLNVLKADGHVESNPPSVFGGDENARQSKKLKYLWQPH